MLKTHTFLLFLSLLILPGTAVPGGFQNNALGMKPVSMGGAFTGFANDATASFLNPGALTFLEYHQIALGASFRLQSTSYLSPYGGNHDMENRLIPALHFYGAVKLNETMSVGLSFNSPFSVHNKWKENWPGRYIAKEVIIRANYLHPSFSYQLNEKFGVGGGPVIAFGKNYLTKTLPLQSSSGETLLELDGKSTGFGFNLGLFYKLNDDFNIGLTYRSSVKMKVKEGDASFSNIPSSLDYLYPASASFEMEYTLPSVITAGVSWKIIRDLTLCADINYTTWKSYDSVSYVFKDKPSLNLGSGKFYENTFTIRVGAEYVLSEKIAVRGGAALDKSPVPDEHLSPAEPDADRYIFSLGGSFKFANGISVDAGYLLQNIKEREVVNKEISFGGIYKNLINIFGVTINYQF